MYIIYGGAGFLNHQQYLLGKKPPDIGPLNTPPSRLILLRDEALELFKDGWNPKNDGLKSVDSKWFLGCRMSFGIDFFAPNNSDNGRRRCWQQRLKTILVWCSIHMSTESGLRAKRLTVFPAKRSKWHQMASNGHGDENNSSYSYLWWICQDVSLEFTK